MIHERFDEVKWGLSDCDREGCWNRAEAWAELWGALCLTCADAVLERVEAVGRVPGLRSQLPDWNDN